LLENHISPEAPRIVPQNSTESLDALVMQIVESESFRSAPMMRTLLTFLWKHRGEGLSEYAVAIDVLGKPPDFDPRTDSSARVQISRLRAKLKEFYQEADESFPLKLSIPLGSHEVQWALQQPTSDPPKPTPSVPRIYVVFAAVALLALSVICLLQFLRIRSLEEVAAPISAPLPRFWQAFVAGSKPVDIVIPSPLYFFWPDRGLNIRDLSILEFTQWRSSPWLRELSEKWGPPKLSQNYVGAPEMNAGIRLLRFLEGRVPQLTVMESRKFAADSVGARNTIFLGMPRTAVYLNNISKKLNFYIERVEPDVIRNRRPLPGEQNEFNEVDYSADRIRFPGIIALLPPRPEHTLSLLLLGRSPVSMATMLSSSDGLRLLEEQWRKGGSPKAWEMVIEADVYRGDTVARVTPVAFRAISGDFWN
jgi:hypothetical protein